MAQVSELRQSSCTLTVPQFQNTLLMRNSWMLLHRGLNFDRIALLKAPRGIVIAGDAIRLEECWTC